MDGSGKGSADALRSAHRHADRFVQTMRERSMGARFAVVVPVLVFAVMVAGAELLARFRAAEEVSQRNAATLAFASELRARADRELNSVLYLASGLVGYLVVRHDRIDRDEIGRILAQVHASSRHVRNFSIAVGYRIEYVYPLDGNRQAMHRDYRDLKDQWPAVQTAVESRRGVLTGPVRLVQGGTALIYRIPVHVGDKYWGLLATVIDMPSFETAAFGEQEQKRFEFAVRSEEPHAFGGGLLFGKAEVFDDPSAVRLDADVPGGRWVYAVRAADPAGTGLVLWLRVSGWLFALLASAGVYTVMRQRSELARHAGFDSLTHLPNRRLFDDRLEQAIRRQGRGAGGQVAVLFLDLDGFKLINDSYGHKFGDAVLRIVASRLRDEVRLADTVARWAGDEFAVIVEDAGEAHVAQLIDRLRRRVAEPLDVDGVLLGVTPSVGKAFYPGEAASAVDLLELADRRMFEDKERRKAG